MRYRVSYSKANIPNNQRIKIARIGWHKVCATKSGGASERINKKHIVNVTSSSSSSLLSFGVIVCDVGQTSSPTVFVQRRLAPRECHFSFFSDL